MIPKIIHYCWFGNNPKSSEIEHCIETWRKFFPDWKIIEWNESNYDVNRLQYTKDAYESKKWAFVSDVARLVILYEYGGIYLDVDVEFIKPLPDTILSKECFCGLEYTALVAPGLIFGCHPKNKFVKDVLSSYENERFFVQKNGIYNTINLRISSYLCERGLVKEDCFQEIAGVSVYPSEIFCGYDTDVMEPKITENTICWHHYAGSWLKFTLKRRFQNLLKRLVGVHHYKKILVFVRLLKRFKDGVFNLVFKN